jgi:hypothetical protein
LESGQPVGGTNFRADVNASGSITAADVGVVKAQSGTQLPRPARDDSAAARR